MYDFRMSMASWVSATLVHNLPRAFPFLRQFSSAQLTPFVSDLGREILLAIVPDSRTATVFSWKGLR
jgi:hypothetical protein